MVSRRPSARSSAAGADAGERVDAHGEPLVGAFDGRMRAAGDPMGGLRQGGRSRRSSACSLDRATIADERGFAVGAVRADPGDQFAGARRRGLQQRVGDLVGDAAVDLVAEAR